MEQAYQHLAAILLLCRATAQKPQAHRAHRQAGMPGLPLLKQQKLTPEEFNAWKAAREQQQRQLEAARAAARQEAIDSGAPLTGAVWAVVAGSAAAEHRVSHAAVQPQAGSSLSGIQSSLTGTERERGSISDTGAAEPAPGTRRLPVTLHMAAVMDSASAQRTIPEPAQRRV